MTTFGREDMVRSDNYQPDRRPKRFELSPYPESISRFPESNLVMTRTLFQNRARPWPQPLAIAFLSSLFLLSAPKSVPSPPGVPPVGLLLDPVDASRSRTVPLKIHLPPG